MMLILALLLLTGIDTLTVATPDTTEALYYVTAPRATVFYEADSTLPFAHVTFREHVHLLGKEGPWAYIRRTDGLTGYVQAHTLSNVWIKIVKSTQTLYVYRGIHRVAHFPVDLGVNFRQDKIMRSTQTDTTHWRTPEGVFFICEKRPRSTYYRALLLNYPTAEDAERGLRDSLITEAEYRAIVEAERRFRTPPMHTALGGLIEIHGAGSGLRKHWTRGCIALKNVHIERIWDLVSVGTPVLILP